MIAVKPEGNKAQTVEGRRRRRRRKTVSSCILVYCALRVEARIEQSPS
jgi:hypothetical protein